MEGMWESWFQAKIISFLRRGNYIAVTITDKIAVTKQTQLQIIFTNAQSLL